MRPIIFLILSFIAAACSSEQRNENPTEFTVSEHTVETDDGITLYYRIAGEGDDTVMVPFALYHGQRLDSLAKGRRIVTYDPRGRGASDAAPLDTVTLDYMYRDFDTVRNAVGAEKVAIIGWSGGGMEMFVYAMRNPDRVTRLIQLAPIAARFDPYGPMFMEDRDRRTDQAARQAFRERVAAGEFDGDPEAHCRAVELITNPPLFADPDNLPETPDVCQFSNEHPDNIGAYFGKLFESIIGYDWRESLDEVSIPRLIIHGQQDNIPLEGNEEWVRGQAHARLLVIEGAGHWPHYEQPEETLKAMDAFLDGEWPEAAVEIP